MLNKGPSESSQPMLLTKSSVRHQKKHLPGTAHSHSVTKISKYVSLLCTFHRSHLMRTNRKIHIPCIQFLSLGKTVLTSIISPFCYHTEISMTVYFFSFFSKSADITWKRRLQRLGKKNVQITIQKNTQA